MNKHYKEIAEVILPVHDGEEHCTTLYIFDVSDEKADELYDIGACLSIEETIKEDLEAYDDGCVMAGAPFHRYSARFELPHTVFLYDTLAYNV